MQAQDIFWYYENYLNNSKISVMAPKSRQSARNSKSKLPRRLKLLLFFLKFVRTQSSEVESISKSHRRFRPPALSDRYNINAGVPAVVSRCMEGSQAWDWNILQLETVSEFTPLRFLGMKVFRYVNLTLAGIMTNYLSSWISPTIASPQNQYFDARFATLSHFYQISSRRLIGHFNR